MGKISYTISSWVKNFAQILHSRKIVLKKVGAWETHGVFKEESLKAESKMERNIAEVNLHTPEKWKELIQKFDAEQRIPEVFGFSIVGGEMRSPLEEGAKEKIIQFADEFTKL
jgi:hypothetical protein